MKKVYVGLSGGVDSSVSALLLKQQDYDVVGVYMKNWSQDLPGHHCSWQEDYQDAKRIAVQLGIEFKMFDFQKDYRKKVVDYMLDEFKAGRTPNPDIMCNQEIKFKLFLETSLEDGADYVATGHYARLMPLDASPTGSAAPATLRSSRRSAASEPPALTRSANSHNSLRASAHPGSSSEPKTSGKSVGLFQAVDQNKDQTYFLCRVTSEALQKTIFPLGELTKPEVRAIAKKNKLVTADKKDSMGICFVGTVGIKDFLSEFVTTKDGNIVDQNGKIIGQHDGVIFYTIGQRHGLEVGGGLPLYVTGKNMKTNEVYVTSDLQDKKLWNNQINLSDLHWINKAPLQGQSLQVQSLQVRTRHRAKLIPVKKLNLLSNSKATIELEDEVRALTPGQSTVFYSGDICLGGGIVI